MKSVVFLVTLFCTSLLTAQNFSKEWKEIYQLEKEGSYKTLKTNVDALYKKAHQSKNEAEKAKAVLFQMKLENVLEETNYQKKVDRLQKELAGSKGIYKRSEERRVGKECRSRRSMCRYSENELRGEGRAP